jgi:hypothetical protein
MRFEETRHSSPDEWNDPDDKRAVERCNATEPAVPYHVSKTRENRIRRAADRRGFLLRCASRRDRCAVDDGLYWLIDVLNRVDGAIPTPPNGALRVAVGPLSIDQLEEWLIGVHRVPSPGASTGTARSTDSRAHAP